MPTSKNPQAVILIIVTGIAIYTIMRSKKLHYLGKKWKHHIVKPSMKETRIKSVLDRNLKKSISEGK